MTTARWHVARWSAPAWAETGIKLAAVGVALRALGGASPADYWTGPALATFGILALLSLGLLAAIWDRLVEREVVAAVFVVLNNVGHWSALARLAGTRSLTASLGAFTALMLAGDLIKVITIRKEGIAVRGASSNVLVALTSLYAAGYAAILVLHLVSRG